MHHKKNYTITQVNEESTEAEEIKSEQETELQEDPLENLPDLSSRTGGLPIVTFILICLSGGVVMVINKILAGGSILFLAGCILVIGISIFGIIALIRGIFTRLHNQQAAEYWYPLSSVIMAASILIGVMIGVFGGS